MLTRRVVRSNSCAALIEEAGEFLRTASGGSELVVLAPTRGAADDLARAACRGGFFGLHRMTLTGLAVTLAGRALAGRDVAPLSRLSAEAMAARVIHRVRDSIPYFRPVADTPGLARGVAATISELRLQSTHRAGLAAAGPPGADLARMAGLFEEELAASSLGDFSIVLEEATAAAQAGAHPLIGLPVLLLDVSPQVALEGELLAAVIGRSPAVFAACLTGDDKAIDALERLLGVTAEEIGLRPIEHTLARVRAWLFSPAAPSGGEPDPSTEYFSAAGESLECVEIARRIRSIARQGTTFDRIAILLRAPERYQSLVEEALRRAAIPAWFSRGVARPDAAGRAFLALLACAAEGCAATRFAEYLSLGQAPAPETARDAEDYFPPQDETLAALYDAEPPAPEEEMSPAPEDDTAAVIAGTVQAPAAWEKLLVDAAVIGGLPRWRRRLSGLEAEFRRKLDVDEETRRAVLLRQIETLKNLERFALPIVEFLDSLRAFRASWGDWLERLADLANMTLRRPESVLSVLAELQAMDEVGPVMLAEVSGVLSERLRFLRSEPPLRRYGRVFVGTIEEARGRAFDVVFLPGLAEGVFPRRATEDPILLDAWRRKIDSALEMQDDRVARERTLLRIACAAAGSRLVFSYPRMDVAQARPRVPSFYALEILRAAYGRLPDLAAFEDTARRGAPSRLDWPAPVDPLEAIDDAEFDLAAIGRIFKLTPQEARGRGRYLIEANDCLVRSLRARARRWRNAWSQADGLFAPGTNALAILAQSRLSARAWSPSSLEDFSACPYRFLLHGIFGLRPREESVAIEQMDPLTRGGLFHRAQFEFCHKARAEGLVPFRPADASRILALADRVLDSVASAWEEDLAPAIPRVWRSEVEDLRTDLRAWVQQLVSAPDGWDPVHAEFSFGLPKESSRDPASSPTEAELAGGVRLRGSIDWIEAHRVRNTLRVTDHKTGKAPEYHPKYTGGGAALQPLAYALAAEKLLGRVVEAGRLWYCTARGDYQQITIPVTDESRRALLRLFHIVDRHIERGFLPAAPRPGACAFCDYRAVCGPYEEQRIHLKNPKMLGPLEELRMLP